MKYYCQTCKLSFEADAERCPKCLRQSSVVAAGAAGAPGGRAAAPMSLLAGPGLVVTIVILVPLMLLNQMEWHLGIWFTFVAALVGFGAGHLVNWCWQRRKRA